MTTDTRKLTLAALSATIYIVLNMIPISQFIGAAVFIPLSIIFVPVMAWLLAPREAVIASIIGGLGSMAFNPIGTSGMGGFAILVPFTAITIGSIAIHNKNYRLILPLWVMGEFVFYLFWYGFEAPIIWGVHYIIASLIALYGIFRESDNALYLIPAIAMAENAMLNVFSLTVLGLPSFLWTVIFPVSAIERVIATIGALLIIVALKRNLPNIVPK